MRKDKALWVTVLVVSVIALIGYFVWASSFYKNGNYGRYDNGHYGGRMMGGRFNPNNQTIVSDNTVKSDEAVSLANAQVNKSDNTITYSGNEIKIVMLGGPEGADGKFVIGGLVNPTLNVPRGARVTLELVNEDEGMPHGVEITDAGPPYPYMSMMQGAIYPGALIQPIPEASENGYPQALAAFTASYTGNYYYICQYPGHAQKGMYGRIIIK